MKRIIFLSIIGVLPSLISIIISIKFGQIFFYQYGVSAMVANAPLVLIVLNEFRHYYKEFATQHWQLYVQELMRWTIVTSLGYVFIINIIYSLLDNGSIDGFSISLFNALAVSNLLMAFVTLIQARFFAADELSRFASVTLFVNLIRIISLLIGGALITHGNHIVLFEIVASISSVIYVLAISKFKFTFPHERQEVKIKKGLIDALAIAFYNTHMVLVMLLGPLLMNSREFLLFFAAYRLTRPIVSVASLFPNYIIKEGLNEKRGAAISMYFICILAIAASLNFSGLISYILKMISSEFAYDNSSFYILIIIGAISWMNGVASGQFIHSRGTSLPLLYVVICASIIAIAILFMFQNMLLTLAAFEVAVLIFFWWRRIHFDS
jgi:hypothetical protein